MTSERELFPSIEDRLTFTVTEASRILGITTQGVHAWIRRGRIPRPTRVSKRGGYRIPRATIVRLLRSVGREVPGLWTRKRTRVLLIDDCADLRLLVAEAFRDPALAVDVQTAASPADGLLLAGSFRPEVVLLDAFFPKEGMTSVQALGIIRSARTLGKIRIVGLYPKRFASRSAASPRPDEYLPKPFSLDELRRVVSGRGSRSLGEVATARSADRRRWEYYAAHSGATRADVRR